MSECRKFLLESIFRFDLDQFDKPVPTFVQVTVYDKEGNASYVQKELDTDEVIKSHGSAFDWSLESLMKSGFDISMSIHTGENDRLSLESRLDAVNSEIQSVFEESSKQE